MTNEQINVAIAEACGWRQSERNIAHWHHVSEPYSHILFGDLPNYCNDLNAMHEAEKVLLTGSAKLVIHATSRYTEQLCRILRCTDTALFQFAHATARQRAEAFLRTLGKWEEEGGK